MAGADSKTVVEGWSSLTTSAAPCSASGPVTGTVVAWVVDSVGWADGMWRRAKRFLSDESTACRISGKVTLRDLSFLHSSLMTVSISWCYNPWGCKALPRLLRWRSPARSSSALPSRRHGGGVNSKLWRPAHHGFVLGPGHEVFCLCLA